MRLGNKNNEGSIVSAELWNPECKDCKCGATASLRYGSVSDYGTAIPSPHLKPTKNSF